MLERCIHQSFNPVWESCKSCAYDPENNKKCSAYFAIHLIQKCQYQISGPPLHTSLKKEWENCKDCKLSFEKREECKTYFPTTYEIISDVKSESIKVESAKDLEKTVQPILAEELQLNLSTLPIFEN